MSARDEAIEAGVERMRHDIGPERVGKILDAAHATGAIVYADELEQVGWWHFWDGNLGKGGTFRYDHSEKGVSEPVYRKRPQKPNE